VDIQKFTCSIQAQTIVSILVGTEYSYRKVPHVDLKTGERRELTIGDYFSQLLDDIVTRIVSNPLILYDIKYAEKEIFAIDNRMFENSRAIRGFIHEIIQAKKSAADPEANDLVSLILQEPSYQDLEEITDDVLILFFAGSKTI